MKIGVFDSGLGGLNILRELLKKLPQYDYVYLGDTKNLPYGEKTQEQIFKFTKKAVNYLFKEQDCALVLVMCNTASAKALRKLQREWLPKNFPDRRILGPIIPTVEAVCANYSRTVLEQGGRVGVLATKATVDSRVFVKEFKKLNPKIRVFQKAAPKLVPLIETGKVKESEMVLDVYLKPLLAKNIDTLILSGSTHYSVLKGYVKKKYGREIRIYSQDEIIPDSLEKYLKKHLEISVKFSKKSERLFLVTKTTRVVQDYLKNNLDAKFKLLQVMV